MKYRKSSKWLVVENIYRQKFIERLLEAGSLQKNKWPELNSQKKEWNPISERWKERNEKVKCLFHDLEAMNFLGS